MRYSAGTTPWRRLRSPTPEGQRQWTRLLLVAGGIAVSLSALLVVLLVIMPTKYSNKLSTIQSSERILTSTSSRLCDPHPHTHTLPLPEQCHVSYGNGHVTNASLISLARCSNCLCLSPPHNYTTSKTDTQQKRLCCTAVKTTNITYSCPNFYKGESNIISNVPVECGCRPCDDVDVTFIVEVVNTHSEPIILANVTVDDMRSYQTDEMGYVGFSVPASQSRLLLYVSALGYKTFKQEYFVLPGQMNSLTLTLTSVTLKTFIPPQRQFLLSLSNLMLHALPKQINFEVLAPETDMVSLLLSDDLRIGESFSYFPKGYFPPDQIFTFIATPDDESLDTLKASYTTVKIDPNSFLTYRTPLYAVSSGQLVIQDERGAPFISSTNELQQYGILATISPDLQPSIHNLHLYVYNYSSNDFTRTSTAKTLPQGAKSDSPQLVYFALNTAEFPQAYLIAFEEPTSCYVPVQALDINGFLQTKSDKISTTVQATTRIWYSETEVMTCITYGHIDSCMAVPCKGELSLTVPGLEGEIGQEDVHLNNIERELTRTIRDGKRRLVFKSERECEDIRITTTTLSSPLPSSSHNIQIELLSDYCINPHASLNDNIGPNAILTTSEAEQRQHTSSLYCSVRVSVTLSPGTSAIITATSSQSEMQVVRINSDDDPVDGVVGGGAFLSDHTIGGGAVVDGIDSGGHGVMSGSGSGSSGSGSGEPSIQGYYDDDFKFVCAGCTHVRCFTFSCGSQVTISTQIHYTDAQNDDNSFDPRNTGVPTTPRQNLNFNQDTQNTVLDSSSYCLPFSATPFAQFRGSAGAVQFLRNTATLGSGQFTYTASASDYGVYTGVPQVARQKCAISQDVGIHFQCPTNEY